MSTFAFRAVDVAGAPSRGEMEADSKAQVTEQLRQRGLIVLEVNEQREAMQLENVFQRFKSVDMRNLAVFSRQFATLINSGMPMLRSLYALEEQTDDPMLKPAIASLRSNVEAGSSLSRAMEAQPGVFDPLYRAMVDAGEGSGRLDESLDRVANQLEKLDALRRQVKSAMVYPAVVFGLALVVMVVVVAVVVPVFVNIFIEIAEEYPGVSADLPMPTRITVGISDAVTQRWYILFPALAVMAYLFFRWKGSDAGRRQWDRFKLKIPKIGNVVAKVALARWSRTFGGTISAGVPILQAIEIAGQTSGNTVISDAMDEVYDSVKRGGSIAKPLERDPIFPPMVSHMVAVGEDSGQLEVMLDKVADFYEAEVDAQVKSLTSLIEPIMIIVVGLMVGFIVISMYLPIFSLYENIR